MQYLLKVERSLSNIKDEWIRLYDVTPEVSPFLSWDAMKIAVRYFYPYYIIHKCRPIFCMLYRNGSVCAITPLLKFRNGKIQLFGNVNGFNESGILFDSESILPEYFRLMKDKFSQVEFVKIDSRSPLSKFVTSDAVTTSNAAIIFPKDYTSYLKELSKSVRQNIRTAYNRVNTDSLSIELKCFIGGGERKLPVKHVIDLYCQRHSERYGVKTDWLKNGFLKRIVLLRDIISMPKTL